MKKFGDVKTHLTLTDKAEKAYNGMTPFAIFEHETESGEYVYTYKAFGNHESKPMSEQELNEYLESWADEEE